MQRYEAPLGVWGYDTQNKSHYIKNNQIWRN
jgi:hypothetical protein